jgi:hypothetical protein
MLSQNGLRVAVLDYELRIWRDCGLIGHRETPLQEVRGRFNSLKCRLGWEDFEDGLKNLIHEKVLAERNKSIRWESPETAIEVWKQALTHFKNTDWCALLFVRM